MGKSGGCCCRQRFCSACLLGLFSCHWTHKKGLKTSKVCVHPWGGGLKAPTPALQGPWGEWQKAHPMSLQLRGEAPRVSGDGLQTHSGASESPFPQIYSPK